MDSLPANQSSTRALARPWPALRPLSALLCAGLLTAPNSVLAAAGWIERVEVAELIATSRHYFEIRLHGDGNPSGCREKEWFYVNYDARGAERIFDLFVDGLKQQIRLRVYVTGVCNFNGYAEISSVSAAANRN